MLHYLTVYTRNLLRKEEGATAIEYGLLVTLIALAIIVAVTAVGIALNTTFTNVSEALP